MSSSLECAFRNEESSAFGFEDEELDLCLGGDAFDDDDVAAAAVVVADDDTGDFGEDGDASDLENSFSCWELRLIRTKASPIDVFMLNGLVQIIFTLSHLFCHTRFVSNTINPEFVLTRGSTSAALVLNCVKIRTRERFVLDLASLEDISA